MTPGYLLLLPLLCLSAFFSASEAALFSLRREDLAALQQGGARAARAVAELLDHPRQLLVAILFGNLVVNFLIFAISADLLGDVLGEDTVGLVLGGVASTALVVVCGEVTPKAMAVTSPRRVALLAGPPLLAFRNATAVVTGPVGRLLAAVLGVLERRLPPSPGPLTEEELRRFVEVHGDEGEIERQASEFLADALELRSRRVHEVMTPRVDMVALDLSTGREGFLELVRRHRVSKVPVHDGAGLDKVSGYLLTREVLARPDAPLSSLVRPMWFVPHTKSLESLLREMTERNEPLALVVSEYGGTDGLVTLEDVVEEITGDIARGDVRPLVMARPDGTWLMAGRMPLREAGELLGVEFPTPGPTTLSGFIADVLGRIPSPGDCVWHAGIQLRVEATERRRAHQVSVRLPHAGSAAATAPPPASQDATSPQALTESGAHRADARLRRATDSGAGDGIP